MGATLGDDSAASLASTDAPPPAPFLMSPPKEKKVGFRQVPVEEEPVPVPAIVEDGPPPPTPAKDSITPKPVLSVEPENGVLEDTAMAVSPVAVSPVGTITGQSASAANGDSSQNGETIVSSSEYLLLIS